MTPDARRVIRRSLLEGVVVGGLGLAGAFAGLGLIAFWIVVAIGAPLSAWLEHRARGI
jgi:hypothetical protein